MGECQCICVVSLGKNACYWVCVWNTVSGCFFLWVSKYVFVRAYSCRCVWISMCVSECMFEYVCAMGIYNIWKNYCKLDYYVQFGLWIRGHTSIFL